MKRIRERLSSDEGFTLIELMVVVLIIAILIAIAIPSFIGFRKNAQDRSVQSDLRSGLLAQKGYWTENNQTFTETAADLKAFEPNLPVVDANLDLSADGSAVCMELESDSGAWFGIYETAAGTQYGKHTATMLSAACVNAPGPHGVGTWGTGW